MAKKSMIAREKRRVLLSKNNVKRLELSAIIASPNSSYEEKAVAVIKLNKRSRDESPCRLLRNIARGCSRAYFFDARRRTSTKISR